MRPRLVMRQRTQTTLKQNILIGTSTLLLNALLVFSYFNFSKTENAYGAGMTAASSGYWGLSGTWSSGRLPANNDTLVIPANKNIVITDMTPEYTNMRIVVYGTLHINGGKKLNMCNGVIDVMIGGEIEGDNNGSMVDMGSNHIWNGSMPGDGPLQISGSTILPVDLTYFKAENTSGGTANLSWETASEVNCDYFSVQRSIDGKNFEELAKISGSGNASTAHQYSFIDDNPNDPVSYYRLREVDFDGKFEIFKTVSINISPVHEIVIYPNPVPIGQSATLSIPAGNEKTIEVSVLDMQGKKIFSQSVKRENTSDNTVHVVTERFSASGTYFVTASGQANKYQKKIIVL